MCFFGESLVFVKWGKKDLEKEILLGCVLGVVDLGSMF